MMSSFDLDLKLPGPEALAVAEKELRETEENVKDGLAKLRSYLEGEFFFGGRGGFNFSSVSDSTDSILC